MTAPVRLLPALIRTTTRRLAWWSVAGCVAATLAIVWLVASRAGATTTHVVTALRWSAVLLAGAVATVYDDPTEDDLAGAVTPVWWRRLVALIVVAVPAAAGWGAAVVLADRPLPWAALGLEAGTLVLVGCAVASTRSARRSSLPAGLTATLPPMVLLVVAVLLPARWALLADPADAAAWREVHVRWAALAAVAAVAIVVTARDPARRSPWRTLRPARPRPISAAPRRSTSDSLPEAS